MQNNIQVIKERCSQMMSSFKRSPIPLSLLFTNSNHIYWLYQTNKQDKQHLKKLAKQYRVFFNVKECISNNALKFSFLQVLGVNNDGYQSISLYKFAEQIGIILNNIIFRQFEVGNEYLMINQMIFNQYGCFERRVDSLECIICFDKFGFNIWKICCGQNICEKCDNKQRCHYCKRQSILKPRQPEIFEKKKVEQLKQEVAKAVIKKFIQLYGQSVVSEPIIKKYLQKKGNKN